MIVNPKAVPGTHEPGFTAQPFQLDQESSQVMRDAINVTAPLPARRYTSNATCWTSGDTRIVVAREPAGLHGEMLWHLSISCADRHPTWDEIKTARYTLLPLDLCFGMLLPPPDNYVNIEAQDHVFHLWEIHDARSPWTAL